MVPTILYSNKDEKRASVLVTALKDWYEKNQRDLVWRQTREPYRIWVSEIMAQQTRITAVLPYYKRFMERFPTIEDLANAGVDDVLKSWEGLGYYSRAHNLLKTAKIVQSEYGGEFPTSITLLRKLPGIGEYTAGAIASICYNLPEPAVDGNVLRVFARLEDNEMDIGVTATKKGLTAFVKELMPIDEPGIFNQSLMELGALVCLPKNPLCNECPVSFLCKAKKLGKQSELPKKAAKKALKEVAKTVLLVMNARHEVLIRQRDEALLKGLWEFYSLEKELDASEAKRHLETAGFVVKQIFPIGTSTHIFTHLKWKMCGYLCEVEEDIAPCGFEFVSIGEMRKRALPTAIQIYRDYLLEVKLPLELL